MFESSSDDGAEVNVGACETEGLDVGRTGAKVGGFVGRIGDDVGGATRLDVGASVTNEYPGVLGSPWNSCVKVRPEWVRFITIISTATSSYHSLHRDQMTVMFLDRPPQLLAAPTQVHGKLDVSLSKCKLAPA